MPLKWGNDYLNLRADVDEGVYHISAADSLGKHEVAFVMGSDEYYVGYVFGEDEAKAAAERHHEFVHRVHAKSN